MMSNCGIPLSVKLASGIKRSIKEMSDLSEGDEDDDVTSASDSEEEEENEEEFLRRTDKDVCPTKEQFEKLKQLWQRDKNRQRKKMKALQDKLNGKTKVIERKTKKVISIKMLSSKMRLPEAKEAVMLNVLREKIFPGLKIVDSNLVKDGKIVDRVMKLVGINIEVDRDNYRRHVELAIAQKLGEFRNNSIRKIRKTFIGKRDRLTGESVECPSHCCMFVVLFYILNPLFHLILLRPSF